ncbi:MAG: glycosyltransferase family 2 protein [Opitutales bacterium]|nr:glycosyltransferase family 2 protein [Opitutales bacterium]
MKSATIIIRSRNDAKFARRTLEAIRSQSFQNFKIICFDNASTDGTADILREFGAEIINVPAGAYVPGKILNMGVDAAKSDIVVFNNLDAVPQNDVWLENLIKPILSGEAQIAYARQTARKDAYLWVARDYLNAFPDGEPCSEEFFSMASSAASAEVFKKLRFDESLKYSEDVMFAKTARKLGFKTAYASGAVAEHSHNYTAEEIARRFKGEGAADREILGGKFGAFKAIKRALSDILKDALFAVKTGGICGIPRAIVARIIQKKSYFLGRKVGA